MDTRIAIGVITLLMLSGMAGMACTPFKPAGADCSGLVYRTCVITDGRYAGISTSMTHEQAFEAVCRNIRSGRFEPNPLVYDTSTPRSFPIVRYEGAFCDQALETLSVAHWSVLQPGWFRDIGMSIMFEDGAIVQINVGYRGWDP